MKAGQVPKGTSPYRGPYTVIQVLGRYTFVMSDGQCWSACCMKHWIHDPLWMVVDQEPKAALPAAWEPLVQKVLLEPWKSSRSTTGKKPIHFGFESLSRP